MAQFKVLNCLTFALAISSWMPPAVLGAPVAISTIRSRGVPTPGQLLTGDGTFFLQGGAAGACGKVHSDSNLIVALSGQGTFSQSLCGKKVDITNPANGKKVTAVVADECPGCNAQSLDLSKGAFDKIADEAQGRVTIKWTIQ